MATAGTWLAVCPKFDLGTGNEEGGCDEDEGCFLVPDVEFSNELDVDNGNREVVVVDEEEAGDAAVNVVVFVLLSIGAVVARTFNAGGVQSGICSVLDMDDANPRCAGGK